VDQCVPWFPAFDAEAVEDGCFVYYEVGVAEVAFLDVLVEAPVDYYVGCGVPADPHVAFFHFSLPIVRCSVL
jgi:hypothetical protein